MMELNFVLSVVNRDKEEDMVAIYKEQDLHLVLTMLAKGTASHHHLSLHDLISTEKTIVAAVADAKKTEQILLDAKRKLFIDIPGNGVMLAVPLKSVGGGRTLAYLTDNAVPDGSVPKMEFNHELIVIILNQNYVDDVMDVARSAGAPGGTVIHAKGTGAQYAKKFFGVSLAEEKEIVLIAAKTDKKTAIMKAVAENVGVGTPAGAIAFSLPISDVAGLREFDCNEKKEEE
ncbi:MAG: P-II family nitrogen regulator [Firmicutes bacterium]|nr:P-II family nitrogen regulator [Bacillota bacterium]